MEKSVEDWWKKERKLHICLRGVYTTMNAPIVPNSTGRHWNAVQLGRGQGCHKSRWGHGDFHPEGVSKNPKIGSRSSIPQSLVGAWFLLIQGVDRKGTLWILKSFRSNFYKLFYPFLYFLPPSNTGRIGILWIGIHPYSDILLIKSSPGQMDVLSHFAILIKILQKLKKYLLRLLNRYIFL